MDPLQRTRSFGWWSLLVWLSLGMVLEALHAFKAGWYLAVVNDARRLMLSLGHAHGTLLALVTIAFAVSVRPTESSPALARAAACLRAAAVLMPLGFVLGGIFQRGADPGWPVVLVPAGGFLLFVGVLLTARAMRVQPAATPAAPAKKAAPSHAR